MHFMNEGEVQEYASRFAKHPTLGPATKFLKDFMEMVDQNSDGWAYWSPAPTAADRLMTLIEKYSPYGHNQPAEPPTMAEVRKTLAPIKSLCTRRKLPCPTLDESNGKPKATEETVFNELQLPPNAKPADFRKAWDPIAAKLLSGRSIVLARYMTSAECKEFMWSHAGVVLMLDNGTHVFFSTDDEGNAPGAAHVFPARGKLEILPIIPA